MAMLAGPRRQKNFNIVPKGKPLYEDENRFGTKLLKKMGWTKGKGLGANEDGSKDFVRVQYKNDVMGMGFEQRDDQWTQHEEGFSALLSSLHSDKTNNDQNNDDNVDAVVTTGFGFQSEPKKKTEKLKEKFSGDSLEEKSKNSKTRVHYKKFTRGKDLTLYSEKDLANIFGKKSIEENVNGLYEQFTVIKLESNENCEDTNLVNTKISMNDYFKQKMDAMKNKSTNREKVEAVASLIEKEEVSSSSGSDKTQKKKKRKRTHENEAIEGKPEEFETAPKKKRITKNETLIPVEKKYKKVKTMCKEIIGEETLNNSEQIIVETKTSKKSKKAKKSTGETVSNQIEKEISSNETNVTYNSSGNVEYKQNNEKYTKKKSKQIDATSSENVSSLADAGLENNVEGKPKRKKTKVQEAISNLEQIPDKTLKTKKFKKAEQTATKVIPEEIQLEDEKIKKKTKASCNSEDNQNNKTFTENKLSKIKKKDVSEFSDKLNSSNDPITSSSMDTIYPTTEELIEKQNSYKVYTISSFCAEKFRYADLELFTGSSLSQINGYDLNEQLQLDVKLIRSDQQRITQLWNCTLDKYTDAKPKKSYTMYVDQAFAARRTKQKIPRLHVKTFKRKQAFGGI